MRTLYHLPLSPFSRKVRLVLAEKRLPFDLRTEKVWERRADYLELNPAGTVPTLVEDNGLAIADSGVICEYLDEAYPDTPLLGRTLAERVEARRLVAWFDGKFAAEVTRNLLGEKVMKRMSGRGNPDAAPRCAPAISRCATTWNTSAGWQRRGSGWRAARCRWPTSARRRICPASTSSAMWTGRSRQSARDWYARHEVATQLPRRAGRSRAGHDRAGALCRPGFLRTAGDCCALLVFGLGYVGSAVARAAASAGTRSAGRS